MSEITSIWKHVVASEGEAVLHQLHIVDEKTVERMVDLFCDCKGKILVTGCGTSGAAAKKIAHSFCCINRPAMYLNPADAKHGGAGVVVDGDIVVILSKGGSTPELVELARICKQKSAMIIVVSERENTPLTEIGDIWLRVKVEKEPDDFNMLATASTLSVISVMDAIIICVMKKSGFSKKDFAVIHPGGAVGERLLHCE